MTFSDDFALQLQSITTQDNIYFCFDNDEAGANGMVRALTPPRREGGVHPRASRGEGRD